MIAAVWEQSIQLVFKRWSGPGDENALWSGFGLLKGGFQRMFIFAKCPVVLIWDYKEYDEARTDCEAAVSQSIKRSYFRENSMAADNFHIFKFLNDTILNLVTPNGETYAVLKGTGTGSVDGTTTGGSLVNIIKQCKAILTYPPFIERGITPDDFIMAVAIDDSGLGCRKNIDGIDWNDFMAHFCQVCTCKVRDFRIIKPLEAKPSEHIFEMLGCALRADGHLDYVYSKFKQTLLNPERRTSILFDRNDAVSACAPCAGPSRDMLIEFLHRAPTALHPFGKMKVIDPKYAMGFSIDVPEGNFRTTDLILEDRYKTLVLGEDERRPYWEREKLGPTRARLGYFLRKPKGIVSMNTAMYFSLHSDPSFMRITVPYDFKKRYFQFFSKKKKKTAAIFTSKHMRKMIGTAKIALANGALSFGPSYSLYIRRMLKQTLFRKSEFEHMPKERKSFIHATYARLLNKDGSGIDLGLDIAKDIFDSMAIPLRF